jgi:hypothetical protein
MTWGHVVRTLTLLGVVTVYALAAAALGWLVGWLSRTR